MTKYPKLRCYGSAEEMFHPLTPDAAFRNYLQKSCVAAKVSESDTAKVMQRYDLLAESGGPEMAFEVTLGSVGVSKPTIRKTVQTIKDAIKESLEQISRNHKIDVNPISRMVSTINKHNALLSKMAVVVNGEPALSEEELEKILLKIPDVCKKSGTYEWTFKAIASEGKQDDSGLSLTVRF